MGPLLWLVGAAVVFLLGFVAGGCVIVVLVASSDLRHAHRPVPPVRKVEEWGSDA